MTTLEPLSTSTAPHDITGVVVVAIPVTDMIALRGRDATARGADLRGEHPIIVEARGRRRRRAGP